MKHELTITLKPQLYMKTAREQFKMTKDFVLDILKPYKHTTVCELTKTNNVHYHSLIDIDGIIQRDILLNRIRPYKYLGKPHLEAVQYEESYERYLVKDIIDTTKILNEHPLLKDDWLLHPSSSNKFIRVGGSKAHPTIPTSIYKEPVPADTATVGSKKRPVDWDALEYGIDLKDQAYYG